MSSQSFDDDGTDEQTHEQPTAHSPQPTNATDAEVRESIEKFEAGQSLMSRRGLMRRGATIAGGAAATATVGSRTVPRFSPIGRAAAIAPVAVLGVAAGAAGVAYLGGALHERYLGDSRDYSGYTGADALHNEVVTGATEMQSADERVMTSIENNIAHSQNVALAKGKAAIIEEMNAENPEEDAQTAMQDAIDAYYATIQENIITHYTAQVEQARHHVEQVEAHAELDHGQVFEMEAHTVDTDAWFPPVEGSSLGNEVAYAMGFGEQMPGGEYGVIVENQELELVDGSTVSAPIVDDNWYMAPAAEFVTGDDATTWRVHYLDGSDTATYINCPRYNDAIQNIHTERDDVNAQLSGFVSDVYAQYSPGDIPTEDLVDPITAATELRQDYDNMAGQGAHAAMLGIPTTADFSALLHIYDEDALEESDGEEDYYDVWAEIFTNHVPEDEDGNEVGFSVGETYDPSTWDAPLYISYNYVDSETGDERGDFTQIESEFSIELVEDTEGNEVENFQTRSRNNQTADVSELQKELEQLRKDWLEMQEEAQEEEEEDGGGGFWDFGDGGKGGPLIGALVAIAAIVGIGQATS